MAIVGRSDSVLYVGLVMIVRLRLRLRLMVSRRELCEHLSTQ